MCWNQTLRDKGLGINFKWYKHHSLDHAVDIIKRKGPVDNYESGLGERLHPQVKTDYGGTNRQPDLVDVQVGYPIICCICCSTKTCHLLDDAKG